VTFIAKGGLLRASPNLAVVCPAASKLIDRGLKEAYPDIVRIVTDEMGLTFVVHPLYDCVTRYSKEQRAVLAYDVVSAYDIGRVAPLVFNDFAMVAKEFFAHSLSMEELKSRIVHQPIGAAAGIYAMALGYLLNPSISLEEVDALSKLSENDMTTKFTAFIKKRMRNSACGETQ